MAKKTVAEDDFSFFDNIKTGDRYADAGVQHPSYGFIDSGSYVLNALLSGNLFGGFHQNRFFMAAGEQGSGKSYMMKNNFIKKFMDEGYFFFYYDTEHETHEQDLIEENGFNPRQFKLIQEHTTVEDVFISIAQLLDQLEEDKGKKMKNERKIGFVLDSLGGLSTDKIYNDTKKGELKEDMGAKAKKIKAMFTNITNRCGNLGIPMFITNHIYLSSDGYGDPKRIANGEGAKYFASVILSMHKTLDIPDKATGEIAGIILEATVFKSRMVKPKKKARLYLDYNNGLNRYYGLHDLAREAGLLDDMSATAYPDLVDKIPKEKNGQKTRKGCVVIKDPKKDPKDWIVSLANARYVDSKGVIGTILEEINEYVKKEYKFRPPKLGASEEDAPDVDDEDINAAEDELAVETAAKLESLKQLKAES